MLPNLNKSLLRMHFLSNMLRRDLLNTLNKNKKTWEAFESNQLPKVDENSSYKMQYTVNNNGNIKVKTAIKEPGKDWDVKLEEYQGDKMISSKKLEGKKPEAIVGQTEQASPASESKEAVVPGKEKALMEEEGGQFEDFHNIFESIEKDFENSLSRNFGLLRSKYDLPEEGEETTGKSMSKRKRSRGDPWDQMFDSMERDFEKNFGETFRFGFIDPFMGRSMESEGDITSEHLDKQPSTPEAKKGESKVESQKDTKKSEGSATTTSV